MKNSWACGKWPAKNLEMVKLGMPLMKLTGTVTSSLTTENSWIHTIWPEKIWRKVVIEVEEKIA